MSTGARVDYLIGLAGACGIPPNVARECSVRDLEVIATVAAELHSVRFEG